MLWLTHRHGSPADMCLWTYHHTTGRHVLLSHTQTWLTCRLLLVDLPSHDRQTCASASHTDMAHLQTSACGPTITRPADMCFCLTHGHGSPADFCLWTYPDMAGRHVLLAHTQTRLTGRHVLLNLTHRGTYVLQTCACGHQLHTTYWQTCASSHHVDDVVAHLSCDSQQIVK